MYLHGIPRRVDGQSHRGPASQCVSENSTIGLPISFRRGGRASGPGSAGNNASLYWPLLWRPMCGRSGACPERSVGSEVSPPVWGRSRRAPDIPIVHQDSVSVAHCPLVVALVCLKEYGVGYPTARGMSFCRINARFAGHFRKNRFPSFQSFSTFCIFAPKKTPSRFSATQRQGSNTARKTDL